MVADLTGLIFLSQKHADDAAMYSPVVTSKTDSSTHSDGFSQLLFTRLTTDHSSVNLID